MKTEVACNAILDYHLRGETPPAISPHLALLADVIAGTEVSYTGYTRMALGTDVFEDPTIDGRIYNTQPVEFPVAGSSATAYGIGIVSASSGGTLLRKAWLIDISPWFFIVAGMPADDEMLSPGHGLSDDDPVVFTAVANRANNPTIGNVSFDTIYYVINAGSDTFQISTTQGGSAVDITWFGAAMCRKIAPIAIVDGKQPVVPYGYMEFSEIG